MELTHRFTVPGPMGDTWARFEDVASLAECFPGAQVTAAEGDSFEGTCKVKLGPIALVYAGAGTFVEKDRDAGRMVLEAKGKDKRGNGTAGATVTVQLVESGDATDVEVHTDLAITGKPAQFGRGVMQDVSDKLLGQFVACLEKRTEQTGAEPAGAPTEEPVDQDAAPASEPTGAAAVAAPAGDADAGPASAPGTAESQPRPEGQTRPPAPEPEALDLGATVLPVLLKSYGKQVAAGLGALALLLLVLRLVRRRCC